MTYERDSLYCLKVPKIESTVAERHGSTWLEQEVEDYFFKLDTDSRERKLYVRWGHDILKPPVTLSSGKALPTKAFYLPNMATNRETKCSNIWLENIPNSKHYNCKGYLDQGWRGWNMPMLPVNWLCDYLIQVLPYQINCYLIGPNEKVPLALYHFLFATWFPVGANKFKCNL